MRKVIVAVLVTVVTFNRVRATLVIDGNVAKIIAVVREAPFNLSPPPCGHCPFGGGV